jgi:hypothetical protein
MKNSPTIVDRLKTCTALVTVSAQKVADATRFDAADDIGTAEVAFALLAHVGSQMACPGRAMFDFAGRRQTETLFGALVGFLLWHNFYTLWGGHLNVNRPVIIKKISYRKRGIGRKYAHSANSLIILFAFQRKSTQGYYGKLQK